MNEEIVAALPADLVPGTDFPAIMIRSSRIEALVETCTEAEDRVVGIELLGVPEDLSELARLPLGMPLTWHLPVSAAPQVYTHTWLLEHFDLAVLMSAGPGFFRAAKTVTCAGIPVIIGLDTDSDCSELVSLLDFYLHDRYLQVPMEFFQTMFASRVSGVNVSLAEIYTERPDRMLYVDDRGNVTASSRLAQAGKFFGCLSKELRIDEQSDLYRFLQNPRKSLFLSGSPCAVCASFDLCEGYLRFVDPNFACEGFMPLFETIKREAAELARDLGTCQTTAE
jgi:hypothetical protein